MTKIAFILTTLGLTFNKSMFINAVKFESFLFK
jgi:hypothetical protein